MFRVYLQCRKSKDLNKQCMCFVFLLLLPLGPKDLSWVASLFLSPHCLTRSCELSGGSQSSWHFDWDWRQRAFSLQRQHLLVHVARAEGYTKVMLGDSCTRVAVKLLTCISLGRGAHLAQDTVRSGLHIRNLVLLESEHGNKTWQGVCVCVFVFALTGIRRLQVWWHSVSEANEGLLG